MNELKSLKFLLLDIMSLLKPSLLLNWFIVEAPVGTVSSPGDGRDASKWLGTSGLDRF